MAQNSLWHEVSEEEKEQIRKDSKNLLNEFASKLSKIKSSDAHFENETGLREEGERKTLNENFKEKTLKNAPKSDKDSIIAEKGAWK